MNILVTGGAGYVGSVLLPELVKDGHSIKCLDRFFFGDEFLSQKQFDGKIELIKGDAIKTIPKFVLDNPHVLISLMYLDFDLYEPTKVALENLVPRMPKGAVIAFDELDNPLWPGETQAMIEFCKDNKLRIQRFPFDPFIGYAVLK